MYAYLLEMSGPLISEAVVYLELSGQQLMLGRLSITIVENVRTIDLGDSTIWSCPNT